MPRQREIEQQDIGAMLLQHGQRLFAIVGIADNLEARFAGEQGADSEREQRMAIGDNDTNRRLRHTRSPLERSVSLELGTNGRGSY